MLHMFVCTVMSCYIYAACVLMYCNVTLHTYIYAYIHMQHISIYMYIYIVIYLCIYLQVIVFEAVYFSE